MKEQILITEGKFDSELLKKILPEETINKVKIVEGMGTSSALSLARSYYAKGDNKILIVIDTDTFDETQIKEKKNHSENLLKMIASNSDVKVILFVPELDTLLFANKETIENLFGKEISDLEFSLYKRDPKFAYVKLSNGKSVNQVRRQLLDRLDQDYIELIRKDPKVQEIYEYFE